MVSRTLPGINKASNGKPSNEEAPNGRAPNGKTPNGKTPNNKAPNSADQPCPCGLDRRYADCCGRFHDAAGPLFARAPDAESLMRSRYSAFVRERADYLLATWHPSTRPQRLVFDQPGLVWLGLNVRRHQRGDDNRATVEFVARSRLAGRASRLHEVSRFVFEQDRWWYVDGDLTPAAP